MLVEWTTIRTWVAMSFGVSLRGSVIFSILRGQSFVLGEQNCLLCRRISIVGMLSIDRGSSAESCDARGRWYVDLQVEKKGVLVWCLTLLLGGIIRLVDAAFHGGFGSDQ